MRIWRNNWEFATLGFHSGNMLAAGGHNCRGRTMQIEDAAERESGAIGQCGSAYHWPPEAVEDSVPPLFAGHISSEASE